MPVFYRNKNAQPDGYNEVHIDDGSCPTPPYLSNRQTLGWHGNCKDAVAYAKKNLSGKSDGCKHCIPACHTR